MNNVLMFLLIASNFAWLARWTNFTVERKAVEDDRAKVEMMRALHGAVEIAHSAQYTMTAGDELTLAVAGARRIRLRPNSTTTIAVEVV